MARERAFTDHRHETGDPRQPRVAGFSLREVVLVVAVTAILVGAGLGASAGSAGNQQLKAAADRIIADMELVRLEAIDAAAPRSIQFQAGSASYALLGMPDIDRPGRAGAVDLGGPPYGVRIQGLDLDGAGGAKLRFDAFGRPVLATGVAANAVPRITIAARGRMVSIRVDARTGKAGLDTGS
jgi:hypothetical protein